MTDSQSDKILDLEITRERLKYFACSHGNSHRGGGASCGKDAFHINRKTALKPAVSTYFPGKKEAKVVESIGNGGEFVTGFAIAVGKIEAILFSEFADFRVTGKPVSKGA